MSENESTNEVAALTVQLLSAYLANNSVASEDLAGLIHSTKLALSGEGLVAQPAEPEAISPAVSMRKSLASPEYIISLIDGKPYKTLKRHLMAHGLTPEAYRSRYGLPASYPMVAPAYSEHRRAVAQQVGLGRKKPQAIEGDKGSDGKSVTGDVAETGPTQPQPALGLEGKPSRSNAAKKGSGDRKSKIALMIEEAPAVQPVVELDKAPGAIGSTSGHSLPVEAAALPGDQGRPVTKKRSARPAGKKANDSVRGKSKAKTADDSEPTAEASTVSPGSAADSQNMEAPAQKPGRRAKLGIFRKSDLTTDVAGDGAVEERADAAEQPRKLANVEPTKAAAATKKTKKPMRMARSAKATVETQSNNSAAAEDGSTG